MKSRVFTLISLFALLAAMVAAPSASAQTSPAQDVYNPNGEVLDVVEGGGNNDVEDFNQCSEADGLDADGNSVETGSAADCAEADEVCAQADGKDANGNSVSRGSAADCDEGDVASVCSEADGLDGDGNSVAYGSSEDCSDSTTPTVSEGELPFTGFEAGLVALAGLALLGGGFAMRRVARRDV